MHVLFNGFIEKATSWTETEKWFDFTLFINYTNKVYKLHQEC